MLLTILESSSADSATLSLSLLSTTKIRPCTANTEGSEVALINVIHITGQNVYIDINRSSHQQDSDVSLVLVLYLCVLEVVSPQRSDLVLTTDVPDCETDVLVLDCLHIKT